MNKGLKPVISVDTNRTGGSVGSLMNKGLKPIGYCPPLTNNWFSRLPDE